jgi:hypothetical protein
MDKRGEFLDGSILEEADSGTIMSKWVIETGV